MDRRDFLKTAGTLVACATVASGASSSSLADEAAVTGQGRTALPLNRNWRFSPTATPAAHDRDFDDSGFTRIAVPHTNLRVPWHSFDEKSYEFVSIYRRHFRLPAEARGRRVFVNFEGVMTAATVWLNGVRLGEYKGGFTPFSFELTSQVHFDGDNVLAVEVDSSERADIPPFGYQVDYLTFGGIYREVSLRIVSPTYLENIFAQPKDVLSDHPALDVHCFIQRGDESSNAQLGANLEATLYDGDRLVAKAAQALPHAAAAPESHALHIENLTGMQLWNLRSPKLYRVEVRLLRGTQVIDHDVRRIGFREARHAAGILPQWNHRQTPRSRPPSNVSMGRPGDAGSRAKAGCGDSAQQPEVQHCSHFALSPVASFSRCLRRDRFAGSGRDSRMAAHWRPGLARHLRRQRAPHDLPRLEPPLHHPLGVRINESRDNHDFYTRTNALAHQLDSSRQTGGIRYFQESEFLEDVFTMNDFGFPLMAPNHPLYLNTEFVGHTYPTKTIDNIERLREHTVRHARVHDQLASNPQYAGGIGWCAFDYNTHANFGSGDRICYHGVTDIFREPKPAAGFYRSQCDPEEEIVLVPAFHWARGDENIGFTNALVSSNCDHLKFYVNGKQVAEADPDRKQFPHLKYAPFTADLGTHLNPWGDLRIDGYIQGKQVISRSFSGKGIDQKFTLLADDTALIADGADTTRVVLRVTDEFDAIRPFASDAIRFELTGPATLIGDNPFSLIGGTGAIWIRAGEQAGKVSLTAHHPNLGVQTIELEITAAPAEVV